MKTLRIEIKYDSTGDEVDKIVLDAARGAAHQMFTTAVMVCGRTPEVAIISDDFFAGTEEIALFAEEQEAAT